MLVKFCKSEHNLALAGRTVRFGTLEYYRHLDPSFLIADPEEGIDTHEVNQFPGIPSDRECIDFLKSLNFYSPEMTIQDLNFRRTFPNCYVWCCKLTETEPAPEDGRRFDPSYDSHYKIPSPDEFASYLAALLAKNVRRDQFTEQAHNTFDRLPISELGATRIAVFHGPVVYVEKKQGRLNLGRFESYAPQIPEPFRPLFVKPRKHADDAEYRFAYVFTQQKSGIALPVRPEPLDVPALPISA